MNGAAGANLLFNDPAVIAQLPRLGQISRFNNVHEIPNEITAVPILKYLIATDVLRYEYRSRRCSLSLLKWVSELGTWTQNDGEKFRFERVRSWKYKFPTMTHTHTHTHTKACVLLTVKMLKTVFLVARLSHNNTAIFIGFEATLVPLVPGRVVNVNLWSRPATTSSDARWNIRKFVVRVKDLEIDGWRLASISLGNLLRAERRSNDSESRMGKAAR